MPTLLVPHEPQSAARVRQALAADLARRGIASDAVDEILLVTTELVGNAVRHTPPAASGRLTVTWDVDTDGGGAVIVQVSDASPDRPTPRRPGLDEPSGRGLAIVGALSDDWGHTYHDGGKHVWARVRVAAPESGARPSVDA